MLRAIVETTSGSVARFTGTTVDVAAAPVGDSTKYEAISTGGSAIFDFTQHAPVQTLSVYVGSIDSYNKFEITTNRGTSYFNGNSFLAHSGNQSSPATNRRIYFEFAYGETLELLQMSSAGIAFEYDDIAVGPVTNAAPPLPPGQAVPLLPYRYSPNVDSFAPLSVPEPQSWALMILAPASSASVFAA